MHLLDQFGFCVRDSANTQREGQGVDEEGLNKHGWVELISGGIAPRLLQDHSPSGEPHCTALVKTPIGSGEHLVNGSEHSS